MMEQGAEEEVFEVYKILARKKTRKGNLEYLVRWKNYGEEDDTWEPIENLQDCDEVLNDFNERLSKGDALHFEQSPKKHRRFQRVTDSPSRDSNASSRGSTPPRTRAILNGPELHRHDQQSRDEGGSQKLASNPEDVSSMMKKRSPNYLKPKTGPKWEFLSISPKLPVDGDHVKKRYHQNSHIKQLFPGNYEREEEEQDIFLSTSPDEETQDSYGSLSNGYNSDIYIPAKRMKKSHSVIGTPLQTMEVSNGNVVIVTGRERMVSVSGIQGMRDSGRGDESPIELLSKFSPVVKLKSITPTTRVDGVFTQPESKRFSDKRKASVIARRRLSQTEAGSYEEEEKVDRRKSVRQIENLYKYKEIVVKKCKGYTQIRLFTTTPLRNALSIKALKELTAAFNSANKDDSKVVFLSGSGSMFCSGLDLQCLRKHSIEERRKAARHLASTLRTFVDTLINFPKVIVVAVNGPAVGIGAAILPLCDIVYASDKAWFHFPYSSLGQTPEGCASLTIPEIMGQAWAGEMLYAGRKLTALEACSSGLVSHVFWPTSLMQEVTPRVQKIVEGSAKMLLTSKALIRSQLKPKLEYVNERECSSLEEIWVSPDFYRQAKIFLERGTADL